MLSKEKREDLQEVKKMAVASGLAVIPTSAIHVVDKKSTFRPMLKKWGEKRIGLQDLDKYAERSDFEYYGLVCGHMSGGLEVIDVDLKVLDTPQQRKEYASTMFSYFESVVDNLYKKVAIYKTKNNGYHILYKAENCEVSRKLATVEGKTEAVIETRGGTIKDGGFSSGYANYYPKFHHKGLKYSQVSLITNDERDALINACKNLSFRPIGKKIEPAKKPYVSPETGLSTWDDYNEKTDVWDLISDQFDMVLPELPDKVIINRHGSNSAQSGCIFKDKGALFLFSTGTQYEADKLLFPFDVYAINEHGGDYSAAARDLHSKGFGSRNALSGTITPEVDIDDESLKVTENPFPLDVFPPEIHQNLLKHQKALNLYPDFLGSGLLWSASVLMGNSWRLEIKKGWEATASVWLCCVAKAGVGKSPALKAVIKPLEKHNRREVKQYQKEHNKYNDFQTKSKEEKGCYSEEPEKPVNGQFIMNDTTLEALTELHSTNPQGIGVYKDELASFFNDMNKYRTGSDEQFWLSSFDGTEFISNRKSTGVQIVSNPHLPILGGIQPAVLTDLGTQGNRADSGFMDRMLFAYPPAEPSFFNEGEIGDDVAQELELFIDKLYKESKNFVKLDDDGEVKPCRVKLDAEARAYYIVEHNKIITMMTSNETNEKVKSSLPKFVTYLGRFTLICHYLNQSGDFQVVKKSAVEKAVKLVTYFMNNIKNIMIDRKTVGTLKEVLAEAKKKGLKKNKEIVKYVMDSGVKFTMPELSVEMEVSLSCVQKNKAKIENE